MNFLYIKRLRVEAVIGTHAWERVQKQILYISIECAIDVLQAAAQDDLEHALDYQRLANDITRLVEQSHFQLIESVAKLIVDYLKEQHGINQGHIIVSKPAALAQAEEVGVVVKL